MRGLFFRFEVGLIFFISFLSSGVIWTFPFELFTHFRVQLFLFGVYLLLKGFLIGEIQIWSKDTVKKIQTGIVVSLVWYNFSANYIVSFFDDGESLSIDRRLRIATANLLTENQNKDSAISDIEKINPDILGIVEVDDKWKDKFEELKELYPYQHIMPSNDNFGVGILSKEKILEVKILEFGKMGRPNILATIDGSRFGFEKPLDVVVAHPFPPMSSFNSNERNIHLKGLDKIINDIRSRLVILGDMNCTPWSPRFFRNRYYSMPFDNLGIKLTWPSFLPSLLRIPIDHIITSKDLIHARYKTFNISGSDHLGLYLDIKIK